MCMVGVYLLHRQFTTSILVYCLNYVLALRYTFCVTSDRVINIHNPSAAIDDVNGYQAPFDGL